MSISNNVKPFVSALLVTFNEEKYIEKSLRSMLLQDYPSDRYEIIIVDGGSTDNTLGIAKELINCLANKNKMLPNIRYLNNPKKILAAGWNLGIKNAIGEYVIRIDAHAEVKADFLSLNVKTIQEVDAICVGGKLITKTISESGEIVKDILSSPFGVGNSSFRTSNESGYVDTAVYGLYKKEIFKRVGYFNEKLIRNQDIEMHSRIKRAGEKFYFNPNIKSVYYSRSTVKKMLKQAYGNGMWNFMILKKNNAKLSLRHLIPFFFVIFLIGFLVIGIKWHFVWLIESFVLALYFFLAIIASIKKTKQIKKVVIMPWLFLALHISYGVGSIVGVLRKI